MELHSEPAQLNKRRSAASSPAQTATRKKFSLAVRFLNPLIPVLNQVYKSGQKYKKGYNAAFSHMLMHAITGDYSGFDIDYSRVRLSNGRLIPPSGVKVSVSDQTMTLTWGVVINHYAWEDDEAVAVLYDQEKDLFVMKEGEAVRRDGTWSFTCPGQFLGDTVHTYLFFVRRDGKDASRSV
ncbi:DUF6266 family protein, partial [Pararcticibacter amylolyticus]